MSINRWKRKDPKTGTVLNVGWEVDVTWMSAEGEPKRHRKYFRTLREGQAHERHVLLQLAAGTFGMKVRRAPTIAEFAPRFMEWSRVHNKPSTVEAKDNALRVHLIPALGDVRLDAAELRAEVEDYQAQKREAGLKAKSINNHLAVLGRLLNLAAERGLVQHVPKLRKLRTVSPEPGFLTFEETEQLIVASDGAWRTWLLVLLRTGLRVGEALALKWKDVDFTTGQLRIRATRWKDREDTPKGGRERIVPLSRDALSALKAHRHLRTYVFDHEDGRPFTHSEVKSIVPRACAAAGLGKRLTTHGLRHTFASHLVMRGTALLVVKELLGHADLSMVLRYAHLAPNITQEAVQVLDLPAQSHADRMPTDREQKEKAP